MTLRGGASDKEGLRYEYRWLISQMIEVLDELADCIRSEPPYNKGIDFSVFKGDVIEFYQVKKERTGRSSWTITDLNREGVLTAFWERLEQPKTRCIFVSGTDTDLRDLSKSARDASTFEEFREVFLTDEQRKNFNKLRGYWGNCSQEDAYEKLKRIWVSKVDEDFLRSHIASRLRYLVSGDAEVVSDVLRGLAQDCIHKKLRTHDIWRHLEGRGFNRLQLSRDPKVLTHVEKANEKYLSSLRRHVVLDKLISRDEVRKVQDLLTDPGGTRGVLITGEAGVGKSIIILQIVEILRGVWPVLAFGVDIFEPVLSPKEVGKKLELPESPVIVLANIAQKKNCLLVIDQLDAVSMASGRRSQFFDCINDILDQARAHPNMRILLGCRKFDLDNDSRLQRLLTRQRVAVEFPVSRLEEETVKNIVAELGLDPDLLDSNQLNLLSLPLHLRLLEEIVRGRASAPDFKVIDFRNRKGLYDKFWDYKQMVVNARFTRDFSGPMGWTGVMDILCEYMNKHQTLSAPREKLDRYKPYVDVMVSEHVLSFEDKRYAFFHQSFFDYVFARSFIDRDGDLLQTLLSGEQHLFRRDQVRQLLYYERDDYSTRYLNDLNALLISPDIRFHLKQVVFALLAELQNPKDEEWSIIHPLLDDTTSLHAWSAWRALRGSVPWFQLLDSLGLIEEWLATKDEEWVGQVIVLLRDIQNKLPNRVAELVEPYFTTSGAWCNRFVYLMRFADLSAGRRFFDLFLKLIDEGALDEAKELVVNSIFFDLIYHLPEKNPEWACESIGHYLNRLLAVSLTAGQPNPFDNDSGANSRSYRDDRIFMDSAIGSPSMFVIHLLPFMLCLMGLNAKQEGDPPYLDPIWSYRYYGWGNTIKHTLLTAMESAMSALARNEPKEFEKIVESLCSVNFETVQYLLIRAYSANGERFADDAADYLCDRSARLKTGYVNNSYWATRQLLEAITPYCSDDKLARLERVILDYYPEWEKSAKGRNSRGYAQFVLLGGIIPPRPTRAVTSRLERWKRKFGMQSTPAPERPKVDYVKSPIPEDEAGKMTDDEWLKAIKKNSRDGMSAERRELLVGGALELSRVLERQVKSEPSRFAELIFQFPEDTHHYYFEAVLRGITDAGLDVRTVLNVCQFCHQLPDRPFGRWIPNAIASLAEFHLPNEALDIVEWYATQSSDPIREEWRTEAPGEGVYYGGDASAAGMNSVRGSAALAVAKLIFYNGSRISYFRPVLEHLVHDPSTAVRSCAAEALGAMLTHDPDLAIDLFIQLINAEDVLLNTHFVKRFLGYSLPEHFNELSRVLRRMIGSKLPEVATVGAQLTCLVWISSWKGHPLVCRCLSGTAAQRLGAAEAICCKTASSALQHILRGRVNPTFQ